MTFMQCLGDMYEMLTQLAFRALIRIWARLNWVLMWI